MEDLLVLPNDHLIVQLTNCRGQDITMNQYRQNIHKYLNETKQNDREFYFSNQTPHDMINYRYPLSTGYFLRNIIQNKSICHIGSKNGDINYEMSKYALKIYNIELLPKYHQFSQNKFKNDSKQTFVHGDILKMTSEKIPTTDVYYTWCGYLLDFQIMDHLIKQGKTGIFLLGVPQDAPKLTIFLKKLATYPYKYDYISIPFRETGFSSLSTLPLPPLARLNDSNWSSWQTFDNLCGVMFLMKVIVP